MIVIDGYSIEHYPNMNKIVITMPQTFATLTTEMVSNRRTDITESELTAILVAVRTMLERRG